MYAAQARRNARAGRSISKHPSLGVKSLGSAVAKAHPRALVGWM